ncbi:CvpA family protein [Parasphingorhabdus cellanae]|uniref:CvpA family protein n=1 Tax=Parasphingorhabdus cellanae TaxID=2806553 RepID=A0ABX7T878_9SPHN|nr:CvpA family protein [Parasphingorhabdus cellanae]QTD57108.1 CvpA family protein [Parasphingorhabdus cellanae]
MTGLDIFVLLLMGGAAVFGFMRGFVQETLSLIAWVLVIFSVRFLHAPVTDFLIAPIGNEGGASVLAFGSIVIVTYALGRWIAKSIGRKSRKSLLGPIDRVLGFGFGMVKGLIGATLAYLLVVLVYDSIYGAGEARPEWIADSRTYPLLNASGDALVEFVEERREMAEAAE